MRFAVKVLSRSDLTFFEPQFRIQNAGNQKSINLNRDVFVSELYPAFPEVLAGEGGQLGVRLQIEGPGLGKDRIDVRRKLAKGGTYKNFRLNGEFVRNPDGDGARFNGLAAGDLAILAFEGAAVPELIRLFVLSASEPADMAVRAALALENKRSMVSVSPEKLAAAIALAPTGHPLHDLLLDPADEFDLENATLGGAEAIRRLLRMPGGRRVTAEQLTAARLRAEETGRDGELLVCGHFEQGGSEALSFTWRSAENAIHPWDFDLKTTTTDVRVEVKATRGDHAASFHISMAELEAAAAEVRYDIYRVSGLGPDGGTLRIAANVRDFAGGLIKILESLPTGVRPDGFTVDPARLKWSEPITIGWLDAEET